MKKIRKKRVYTYYTINLRFRNDDEEDMKLFRKFKSIKYKSNAVKDMIKVNLKGE